MSSKGPSIEELKAAKAKMMEGFHIAPEEDDPNETEPNQEVEPFIDWTQREGKTDDDPLIAPKARFLLISNRKMRVDQSSFAAFDRRTESEVFIDVKTETKFYCAVRDSIGRHPNLMRILGVYSLYNSSYVVTDYVQLSLWNLIGRENINFSDEMVAYVAKSCLTGLIYLKRFSLRLSTLETSKIMIDDYGRVKLSLCNLVPQQQIMTEVNETYNCDRWNNFKDRMQDLDKIDSILQGKRSEFSVGLVSSLLLLKDLVPMSKIDDSETKMESKLKMFVLAALTPNSSKRPTAEMLHKHRALRIACNREEFQQHVEEMKKTLQFNN